MLGHVVMFKFRPEASAADRARALELLRGMQTKAPGVLEWRIGEQYEPSEKRWDVVELAAFQDEASLAAFQTSEAHRELTDFMKGVSDWHVVDYKY